MCLSLPRSAAEVSLPPLAKNGSDEALKDIETHSPSWWEKGLGVDFGGLENPLRDDESETPFTHGCLWVGGLGKRCVCHRGGTYSYYSM